MKKRKPIRLWRVERADPFGLHLWFDPATEFPRLYELEPPTESGVQEVGDVDDHLEISQEGVQDKQQFLQEELPF